MNKPFYRIATEVKKLQETDPQLTQQLRKYIYNIVGCCQTVHRDMGPFLNEYMYQDALEICLSEAGFCGEDLIREYYFKTSFHNRPINHPHKVDFLVNGKVFVECKLSLHYSPNIANNYSTICDWQAYASAFSIISRLL